MKSKLVASSVWRWPYMLSLLLIVLVLGACSDIPQEGGRIETPVVTSTRLPATEIAGTSNQDAAAATSVPTAESVSAAVSLGGEEDDAAEGDPQARRPLAPGEWMDLPVVPEIDAHARQIFEAGIASGNDPKVFAKVGDCQNVPSLFLSIFDYPGYYSLGDEYEYLQRTIDWYSGSFVRESEAVRRGFNAASVVSPVWADPETCESGETPLVCEIRVSNPSVAIISLETWWAGKPENYEKYVRQIIEGLLEEDILPIVATKADNLEGDHQINEILVRLANEYQIPVWNFWKAVQPLPGNGLMEDEFHLTFDDNHFDDPDVMKSAWPWRNLTALQVLDAVYTELISTQQ